MMNSFLQMGTGGGQMPTTFGHHAHNTHYSSSSGGSAAIGGGSSSSNLNPQHVYHHPHHAHHHHHSHHSHHPAHLGQLYHPGQHPHFHQSRPSFAIQEILGLGCGRQGASTPPSPGTVSDTASATAAAAAAAAALMASGGSESGPATSVSSISSSSSVPGLGPGGMYFNSGASAPLSASQTLCGPGDSLSHHHHPHHHPHSQNMQAGASGFPTPPLGGHHHPHHGAHQSMAAGSLYPWRFDLASNVGTGQALSSPRFPGLPGRHSDDIVFDYKHSIGDDGE
ncbi:hypothetical protein EGW08_018987 [Elysia chlorotica]|uniref:Uncharacterized protein n=1 Tax=Elysia chlorotica TaxID=188477 RepID=A0A433SVE0_ELYCH|nr:hypothetical protein EGW08_018987 [Elysia chlorotica]